MKELFHAENVLRKMAEGNDKDCESNQDDHSNITAKKICCPAAEPGKDALVEVKMNEEFHTTQLKSQLQREKSKTPPPILSHNNNLPETKNMVNEFTLKQMVTTVLEQNGICAAMIEPEVSLDQGDRRQSKSSSLPHGVKLCAESTSSVASEEGLQSVGSDIMEDKWACLEQELRKAQTELKAKDAEVEKLKGIRQQVEEELDDLTASLFEEAHKMVKEAKMKEISSEKSLKEAKMQLEGLQAEVAALKTLLITSTPSRPNLSANGSGNGISIFKKQHKRYPSHNHLQYGRSDDESEAKEKDKRSQRDVVIDRERCQIDPNLHELFSRWRQDPSLSQDNNTFLTKLYTEDVEPCLEFQNKDLVPRLRKAIEDNSIWVEPLPEKEKTNAAKNCALLRCPRVCHYRMRFAFDSGEWFDISQFCRDRIAAVCEFLNYLRYIKNGLVKASVDDAYWEIIRLRKQMAIARLGIPIS